MSETMKIALVLDATGSMLETKQETIDAVNEYISELKIGKDTKKAKFTLATFNSATGLEVLRDDVLMAKVKPVTDKEYICEAMTPLRDAVGGTIAKLSQTVDAKQRVMVTVLTDGLENCSREYNNAQLASLIKEKEATDYWSFVFLGADIDAWSAQQQMGTQVAASGSTMSFPKSGLGATMKGMAHGTQAYAASGASSTRSFSDYLDDPDARLDTAQAAIYTGYSPYTLVKYRTDGNGPAYTQHVNRGKVVYSRADLDAWMKKSKKRG